jgi:hypothetical protein
MAAMDGLYGRYHGRILQLAGSSTADGAWKAKLREILAEFDDDRRHLSTSSSGELRHELASQIEQEVLRFSDPCLHKTAITSTISAHYRLWTGTRLAN